MSRCLYGLAIFAVFTLPCKADEAQNVRVVEAMIEAINSRNLDALDALVSPNIVRYSAATPGVVVTNLSEFRAFLEVDIA